MTEVTPNEIAKTLGVSPKTLRAWLREGRKAGHPLLSGHEHYGRWSFTTSEAEQLVAEYRGSRQHATSRDAPAARRGKLAEAASSRARSKAPPLPTSFSREALSAIGFAGWVPWSQLRESAFAEIPSLPGVYAVVRAEQTEPEWVHPGSGGRFKGRDPSVHEDRLKREWIAETEVLYLGKAGLRKSGGRADGLRKRLSEYGRFGAGEPVGHWGGRLVWQLADADALLVGWHAITWDEAAREYESRLLRQFTQLHAGRRPFANLTG